MLILCQQLVEGFGKRLGEPGRLSVWLDRIIERTLAAHVPGEVERLLCGITLLVCLAERAICENAACVQGRS